MSLIDTPEIASAYGTLDDTAFEDGMCFHAHMARTITMNASRLASKGQHLFTLVYPIQTANGETTYNGARTIVPTTAWTRLTAPIAIPKRPGLSSATVYVMAQIWTGHQVWMQVTSQAHPFLNTATPQSTNVIEMVGTGSLTAYNKSGILVSAGQYDEIEILVKGVPTTDSPSLADSPDDRSGLSTQPQYEWRGLLAVASETTWTTSGYSRAGTEIEFYDANAEIITRRVIVGVDGQGLYGYDYLEWYPPLSHAELDRVREADDWALFQLPTIQMSCFSMAADPRSL